MLADVLLAIGCVLCGAWCVACWFAVRGSLPAQLTQTQKTISQMVDQVLANQESTNAKLVAWREDIEGVLEAVEGTLERVETKRRSAAASASRAKNAAGVVPEFDPTNREHLRARARAMGVTDVM